MNLKEIVTTLQHMQADGVIGEYAIGGAVAATFYSVEVDATFDVDVFTVFTPRPGQLVVSTEQISTWLKLHGYQSDAKGDFMIADWPVQFLPPPTPLVEEALQNAIEKPLDGQKVRIFTLEYLAAIALQLRRDKDKIRLARFVKSTDFDDSVFSDILERYELQELWGSFKKHILD